MEFTPEKLETFLTEQKRSARLLLQRDLALQKANEQLVKLDKEKSEFISIIAHQLRTPLAAIKWSQNLLIDGEAGALTPQQLVILQQSQESLIRLIGLVKDLLEATNLEFNDVQMQSEVVDLTDLLTLAANELALMANEKNITIKLKLPEVHQYITGDELRLKEVLLNLINNSIKYTKANGVVELESFGDKDTVFVTVSDNGIGIPESVIPRLFEKFTRADNARRVDAGGTGLGLFIVKKIVVASGGDVSVDSTEGTGSTFTVKLPKTAAIAYEK